MRQMGAAFLRLWYGLTLATSLVEGLKLLSGEHSQGLGQHYVLAGLLWACGIGIASYFAGLRSQKYPVLVAALSALLPPLIFSVLLLSTGETLELDFRAEALAFGWTPTANFVFYSLSVVVLIVGLVGGLQAPPRIGELFSGIRLQ